MSSLPRSGRAAGELPAAQGGPAPLLRRWVDVADELQQDQQADPSLCPSAILKLICSCPFDSDVPLSLPAEGCAAAGVLLARAERALELARAAHAGGASFRNLRQPSRNASRAKGGGF
jgi:hypothetical protein